MLCVRPIKTKFFYKCFVSSNRYSSFYYIKTVTQVDEGDLYVAFKDKETEWSWFLDQCESRRVMYDRDRRLQKLGV